jgi:cation diffusion facilitator CzcD-associated flavoprotein CzcO
MAFAMNEPTESQPDLTSASSSSPNPATPLSKLPGTLPHSIVPDDIDPLPMAQAALMRLRLRDRTLLTEDTLWRDLFALTGTTRTFSGSDHIWAIWNELSAKHQPDGFALAPQGGASIVRAMPTLHWIQVKFSFTTSSIPKLRCTGLMRLVPGEGDDYKVWFMTTILDRIEGFPDPNKFSPAEDSRPATPESPLAATDVHNCVIIGAGMAGLCLAGYMKALGCRATILERNEVLGKTWEGRYDSVSIHTSRSCGQLPFENVWGPECPHHLGREDLLAGFRKWARKYLPHEIWLSTELIKARWSAREHHWTLAIRQLGVLREIVTKHLVFALGLCSLKYIPDMPNRDAFKGIVLHGSEYKNSNAWNGLRAVIIGAANTGHDCADDMLKAGLSSVTIVQRGATPVLPVEYYSRIYDGVYNDKMPVTVSDTMMVSTPTAITRLMAMRAIGSMMAAEPERFEALEKQGFKTIKAKDFDLYHCLLERFGSHYIDVGVSKKIADGLIKVKSDAAITKFTEKGLAFNDGSALEADIIVFATGYQGNMKLLAAPLLEAEVANKLHDYWHVDDEGEIRGAWKPIGRKFSLANHDGIQLSTDRACHQTRMCGTLEVMSSTCDTWQSSWLCLLLLISRDVLCLCSRKSTSVEGVGDVQARA